MAPAIAAAPVATPLKAVPSKAAPSKGSAGKTVAVRSAGADADLVRSYLRDIGRVPLLSH